MSTAYLAAGCFWCTEAVFKMLPGVLSVTPGYAGGDVPNPTYDQVSTGTTGHAETAKIEFDPAALTFARLLDVFFQTHDPTTPNRQGNDVGTQYRSVIFYADEEQKAAAEEAIKKLEADRKFPAPIVTEVVPLKQFWPAESYHKDYYENHKDEGYCRLVIKPKVEKMKGIVGS